MMNCELPMVKKHMVYVCTMYINTEAHANYMPLFNNEGYKEIYKRVTFALLAPPSYSMTIFD